MSAILYHDRKDWDYRETVIGETATENNASLRARLTDLEITANYLNSHQSDEMWRVVITTPSNTTIIKATNSSPHNKQDITIKFLTKLGELMDTHPNTSIQLLWLPRDAPFVGFKRARQLALEAIHTAVLNPEDEPHTIKNHRKTMKQEAIAKPPDGCTHSMF